MRRLTVGILAHVDAGKTTLSEGMLYESGSIRTAGRVDKGDTFLDTHGLEKERSITIFSKQAQLSLGDLEVTLLDTPGHVDFSAEMERTLQVLDYAILVISAGDGVQGHTKTLWRLLEQYQIPVFLFVNKMDQPGADPKICMELLIKQLNNNCVDFQDPANPGFFEQAAMCREEALEEYLDTGVLGRETLISMIQKRQLFPCLFGSALRLQGISAFLKILAAYTGQKTGSPHFGARVFKIARDDQGNRLTFLKITGGRVEVRDSLPGHAEKITQIRLYSGARFETVSKAEAGMVCAFLGISDTFPGEGLGVEQEHNQPFLEPVLTYEIQLPCEVDPLSMLPKLKQLEDEDPMLRLSWQEENRQIQAQVMGAVQIEILKGLIRERFQTEVEFASGAIVYKETIANKVEGVGHFEPLRHYAEVHLILEPGPAGSGLQFTSLCSEDQLDRNWQRLVLTHLAERRHKGVLTGSDLTDMKMTLAIGRAHSKHTEGGDFRQATYRAVRQGLMEAGSVLLEPYYAFTLEIPEAMVGRAMTDMENRHGTFDPPQFLGGTAYLQGMVPVATLGDYQREVMAYTRGYGHLTCWVQGYDRCHNESQVIEGMGYDPESDLDNPSASVFCAHGAGFIVPWDQVKEQMHLESCLKEEKVKEDEKGTGGRSSSQQTWIDPKEVEQILNRASFANQGKEGNRWKKTRSANSYVGPVTRHYESPGKKEAYLLVDGYNIIFAWEDLKELAQTNLDGARGRLLDILCDFQAVKAMKLIVVFDAYRVSGHQEETLDYHNIHVVYTREAETADHYIERFTNLHSKTYDITVATSDGLEQIIIRGQGCGLLSAGDLKEEVELSRKQIREEYLEKESKAKTRLAEAMPKES